MIEIGLKIIKNSNLQNNIKDIAINLLEENIMYGSGAANRPQDFEETVSKLEILEKDINNLGIEDELLTYVVFNVIKSHCRENPNLEKGLIDTFFQNDFLRIKLKFMDEPQTGVLRFLKGLVPLTENLYENFNNKKYFDMLRSHEQIVEYSLYYGINKEIIDNDQKLSQELFSRFPKFNRLRDIDVFRKITNRRYVLTEENFRYYNTLTSEGYYVQKYLNDQMFKNKDITKATFRIFTNGMNIYNIGGLSIFTYRFDDIPKMILKDENYEYGFNDREFWTKIFNMDFVGSNNIHYFNEDTFEMYKVVPKLYNNKNYKYYNNKVVIIPNEYIDDGLKISRDKDYNNPNLFTGDKYFYFKDPTKVENLVIENPNNYPYIELLKSKEDKEARKRSISALKGAATKNPKKETPDWRKQR